MLPPGFSADVAPVAEQAELRPRLAGAQTVARLRVGGCACALRLAPGTEPERHLRRRYAALGLSRERIIAGIDRHRRGAPKPDDPSAWQAALAGFVAEHARNAGPSLYYLGFQAEPAGGRPGAGPAVRVSAAVLTDAADTWLEEGRLIEVTR